MGCSESKTIETKNESKDNNKKENEIIKDEIIFENNINENLEETEKKVLKGGKNILSNKKEIFEVIHKESVTSTMPESNDYIDKMDVKKPFILNADEQTQGKGTGNRKWNSSIKGNVYTTTCIPEHMIPEKLKDLQIFNKIVSLSIVNKLNDIEKNSFFVKQPNDILCKDGCKMGGILIKPYNGFYTIGFGVNLVGKSEEEQMREGGKKPCFLAFHTENNIPSALDFSVDVSYQILEHLKLSFEEIQKEYFSHELTSNILIGGVIKNFIKK